MFRIEETHFKRVERTTPDEPWFHRNRSLTIRGENYPFFNETIANAHVPDDLEPRELRWPKEQTAETLNAVRAGERREDRWSTGGTKKIESGDRFLFIRLGTKPRALFASGRAVSEVYQDEHYNQERAEQGDEANYVDFVFDEFIDPNEGLLLDQDLLAETFPDQHWSPQVNCNVALNKPFSSLWLASS